MKPRHWLFLLLGALTLLRFVLATSYELTPDECYYFQWAQHPDWSYFSKGPGVAMAMWASTALLGPTVLGVRFLSPLLALATSFTLFFFTRRVYSEKVALWAVLLFNCIPIFNVGALVMTIDPLSIFFWAASLYTFWLALENSPRFTGWWPLTGLLIGLGFLSKYTNAMELLSIFIILGTTTRYRPELRRPGLYSLLAVVLLCTLPVVVWNQQHAWITLDHLSARGGLNSGFAIHPSAFLAFLLGHCLVYSPIIFCGLLVSLWWARDKARTQFKARFLAAFAIPLLVMYSALALKQPGEPNWTAPAFISLGMLGTALWMERMRERPWLRRLAFAGLALGLLMSGLTLSTDLVRALHFQFSYEHDPSSRLRGWESGATAVQQFRHEFEQQTGQPVFMIANKYQTAATLGFYMTDHRLEGPGHPPVYIPESQNLENQFSFWPRYDEFVTAPPGTPPADPYYTEEHGVEPFAGRNALYVTDQEKDYPPSAIQRGFEKVEFVRLFRITRRGEPLRDLRVFACYKYHSLPL